MLAPGWGGEDFHPFIEPLARAPGPRATDLRGSDGSIPEEPPGPDVALEWMYRRGAILRGWYPPSPKRPTVYSDSAYGKATVMKVYNDFSTFWQSQLLHMHILHFMIPQQL